MLGPQPDQPEADSPLTDRLEEIDRLLASGVLNKDEHAIARRLAILNAPQSEHEPAIGDAASSGARTAAGTEAAGWRRWRLPAVIGAAAALGALASVAALLLLADSGSTDETPAVQPSARPATKTPRRPPVAFRNVAWDAAPPDCTNGATRTLWSPSPGGSQFTLVQRFTIIGAERLSCTSTAVLGGVISQIEALSRTPQRSQQRNDGTYVGVGQWIRLHSPSDARARYIRYAHGGAIIQVQQANGLVAIDYYYDEYGSRP